MDSSIQTYITTYDKVTNWINNSLDEVRNYLSVLNYPLFVYMYIELISEKSVSEGKPFFSYFKKNFLSFKSEIDELDLIKDPINKEMRVFQKYTQSKVHVYFPKIIYDVFIHFLNSNTLTSILLIINKYFEKSSLLSKVKDNNYVLLNLTADEVDKINCRTQIYTNKIYNSEEIDLKIKKLKGDKAILAKYLIPIPQQYFYYQSLENSLLKIENNSPPTVGCFTILNSHNKLNACEFSSDGSIIALGMSGGSIQVFILDPSFPDDVNQEVIDSLQEFKDEKYEKMKVGGEITFNIEENKAVNEDSIENLAWDNVIKNRRTYFLYGHSDCVYSLSISYDCKYLVSGSYDQTIRLWSLLKRQVLVIYKGHFSPVLSVKFSPLSHYFASGGCDRTAKLWTINTSQPIRLFVGHMSDVDIVEFHPNGLYLATSSNDSTVRLWALENGECIRVIYNYSNKSYIDAISFTNSGKLLTIACNNSIIIYDLVKMGDPIRIIDNFSSSRIYSISFDMEDMILAFTTEDYKLNLFDFHLLLNEQLPIRFDLKEFERYTEQVYRQQEKENEKEKGFHHGSNQSKYYLASYSTKKTTLLNVKFTSKNIILCIGRFDDNDPKIFI